MTPWSAALVLGARLALNRISGRSTLLITLAAVSFSTLAAWAERHDAVATAVNNALRGPGFGLAIPVASFSLVTVALSRNRLDESVCSVAILGGSRRAAAVGALGATSAVCGMLGFAVASTTTLVAYGRLEGPVLLDALTASWIGALTASVYAFYYGAASSFGKRGGGRHVSLLADLILGPLMGTAAVVFPRAHALNLLGSSPVVDLPQAASAAILVGMMAVFAVAASLHTRS